MQSFSAPTTVALSSVKISVQLPTKQHPPHNLLSLLHDTHLVAHESLMYGICLPIAQYPLILQDRCRKTLIEAFESVIPCAYGHRQVLVSQD